MFSEDALLPISALQHLLFCERQCALIHVEKVWAENYLTIQGQHLHKKAHQIKHETRKGVRIARALSLCSSRLGLVGKADIVEFASQSVVPIEYKRGRPKKDDSDRVQLCAQALCLEEMLNISISTGEIFYGQHRRRIAVSLDDRLRRLTEETAFRLHALIAEHRTPLARFQPKCEKCSLIEICLPAVVGLKRSASRVVSRYLEANLRAEGPETDNHSYEMANP